MTLLQTYKSLSNEDLVNRYIESYKHQLRCAFAMKASIDNFIAGDKYALDTRYLDEKYTRSGKIESNRTQYIFHVLLQRIRKGTINGDFINDILSKDPEIKKLF